MVGMKMRIDDVADAHAGRFGGTKIRGKVTERINDGCSGAPAAAEQIGSGYRIGVQELAQDHRHLRARFAPSSKAQHVEALPGWGEKFIHSGFRAKNG